MIFAPHRLMVKVVSGPSFDEEMNPVPEKGEWVDFGLCRCDDNGAMKQASVNGVVCEYNYHIIYEGERILEGTKVRVLDESGGIRAEGEAIKSKRCNFFSYSEVWL